MGRVGVGRVGPLRATMELLVLAMVPVGLLSLHLLIPAGVRETLVLDPVAAIDYTLVTSAFVHLDGGHLYGNVAGFTIAVGYAYVLAIIAAERRWFWVSFLAIFLAVPVLVNATWVIVVRGLVEGLSLPVRGYSGVVAGYGGLLFVALWVVVGSRRSRETAGDVAWIGLLGMLGTLEILYADEHLEIALGVTAIGIAISVVRLLYRGAKADVLGSTEQRRALVRDGVIIAVAGIPLGVLLLGLFPGRIAEAGVITNVFAHFIGFGYGVVISRWAFRYWRRRPLLG